MLPKDQNQQELKQQDIPNSYRTKFWLYTNLFTSPQSDKSYMPLAEGLWGFIHNYILRLYFRPVINFEV